ncbi:hypothetical protein B0H99_1242 [Planomicrobium soli]|uniref:Uncharacterized protein n=1 Tax=Planomicrobium soli TaxID=1176648 RepID=A0A2P8FS74_9BACL|nr:hypothetical protein [Planomicrobium soli]PSL24553.1 hypothetical protein B0H99_1242 [Planomicrobium soli]
MKFTIKQFSSGIFAFGVLVGGAFNIGTENVLASETAPAGTQFFHESQWVNHSPKYSKQVMHAVRVELGIDAQSNELDKTIEEMPKVQVMDHYSSAFGNKVKGTEVRLAVKEIFSIDLSYISKKDYGSKLALYPEKIMESLRISFKEQPQSTRQDERIMGLSKNDIMDRYMKAQNYTLTAVETRMLINQIYGVNLNGISNLEHSQLAISSKGQWIVKSDTDLFILESSLDDVDVSIYATDYFKRVTGSDQLPESLASKLLNLGFTYKADSNVLYYRNPANESVPDAFKGQVIGILLTTITAEFKN